MFTGIVQIGGKLRARTRRGPNYEVDIEAAFECIELGESIAVNGVCLTVTRCLPDGFTADVSLETHERTTLGRLPVGARLNLERALAVGERLGGHFVSGHVDGEGRIVEVAHVGDARRVRLRAPADLLHLIAVKGSLCVDGVSLTVNAVRGPEVELMLIPHTLAITTLADLRPGQELNLEVDLLARYVERCLQGGRLPATSNGPVR
jgi:riboflavin synthase